MKSWPWESQRETFLISAEAELHSESYLLFIIHQYLFRDKISSNVDYKLLCFLTIL